MKEKERGGEGPITKMRKVDDEERNDGMPFRNQRSKKGVEVEVETVDLNSTHLGFKKKKAMKSDDGDGHASISARTAKRADNTLPKLVCTQDEAKNPTTASSCLSIPSELCAQDEDGGILPPSSSSLHFPALDEAVGSHHARTLPAPSCKPKHDTRAPPHLSTHSQTTCTLRGADDNTPEVAETPKMNAPKHGRRWR